MTKKIVYSILFLLVLHVCCKQKQRQPLSDDFTAPGVFEIKGHVVPQDKIAPPEIIPAKEIKSKAIAKPTVIPIKSNVLAVGKPNRVAAGAPRICIPGQNGFSLPESVPAIDSPFVAGQPEITIAMDPQTSDKNPESFSTYKVLQGLKSNWIYPITKDKTGNIWVACFEGGVSRYDGRSFTNYTMAQGLIGNNIWSMMEDSKGNLWFGVIDGGLSKFDGRSFTNYNLRQGLSDSSVINMLEDSKGNLWFCTEAGGVNKYDGKTFTHFTTEQGLADCNVLSMMEDSEGNLWFATFRGISKYDHDKGAFLNYTEGLADVEVMDILQDRKGKIWFSTRGNGVIKFDGEVFEQYSIAQGLPASDAYNMLEDRYGNLWFAMHDEYLIKYDGASFTQFGTEQGLSSNTIHSICEDRAGSLWFGTNDGLCKYTGNRFKHYNFSVGQYNSTYEDDRGNLWLGVHLFGVSKFDGNSVTHYSTSQGLSNTYVQCVLKDSSDIFWVGTQHGGLNKWDGNSFVQFGNFDQSDSQHDISVWAIRKDSTGNLWIGTSRGLYKYDGTNFIHFGLAQGLSWESICTIWIDKKGNLWLGTEYDGVVNKLDLSSAKGGKYSVIHYDINQGLTPTIVYAIVEDKNSNIWIGTQNGGAIKFDGRKFTRYTTAQGLTNNAVNSIAKDKNGNLWFLTMNGLCKMRSPGTEKLDKSIPGREPISLFTKYSYADGFLGVGSHLNSMTIARDGRIWAGTSSYLTSYQADGDVPDTIPPQIRLTAVSLFSQNINWLDLEKKKDTTLVLANGTKFRDFNFSSLIPWYNLPENLQLVYNNNYITFQFVGITTNRPKEIRYKYFLEGLDENWSTITAVPEATYNNLPHGSYTMRVKAANSEGFWSDELAYSFSILPPWWKTWWFRATAALCLLAVLYGLIRWRLQQKFRLQLERSEKETKLAEMGMKTAELQQQATELEMQALRAQMNPHFIFNSLNSINAFILENNKLKASEYLSKFSRLVRLILQNSQEAFIPLDKELEALQLYLELESLRFEQKFEYKISVNDDIDTTLVKVPPLIIQPYAENAIWHGLMHLPPDSSSRTFGRHAGKKEKGHLEIELYIEEKILFCKITDDGVGRKRAEELKSKSSLTYKSMGMRITADRIAILQQQEDNNTFVSVKDLVFPDNSPAGTEVLIKIPLRYD